MIYLQKVEYPSVQRAIGIRVVSLQTENTLIIEPNIAALTNPGEFYPPIWEANNPEIATDPDAYLNDIIYSFISPDKYNLQYKIIVAQNGDTVNPLQLANSTLVQSIMFNIFLAYATGGPSPLTPLIDTFNDFNLQFHFNVSSGNYSLNGASQVNSVALFNAVISQKI